MNINKDLNYIIGKIESFESGSITAKKLPADSYYLDEELILMTNPINSGARFPYAVNGMTIWAYASGYISLNHSSFYIIPPSSEGKEPYVDFFAMENDKLPISLLGISAAYNEEVEKRYTVFSKNSAYYVTRTKDFYYVVSVYMDAKEATHFNVLIKNRTNKVTTINTSSFFNMLFKFADRENFETKWFKKVTYNNDTFVYESPEDIDRHTRIDNYGLVKTFVSKNPISKQITTSRADYVGSRNASIRNAKSLLTKKFEKAPVVTHFSDTGVNADLLEFVIEGNEEILLGYEISKTHSKEELEVLQNTKYNLETENNLYNNEIFNRSYDWDNYHIKFNDLNFEGMDEEVLNQFIKLVNYEVHFAALSSNSGTVFLGVRDVMQQLESSLIFDPKNSKNKMLEVLNFIDSTGIPPRQYSIPPKGSNALMDLRPFIDQGVWIVSTIHTYLSYTNDYAFLDELASYYDRIEPNQASKSDIEESVYKHLIRVTDYLVSQIDKDTNCLKTLYGDWNDALDGLGLIKGEKGYGNGVSVMASLQLYDSLTKMIEIANKINDKDTVKHYEEVKDSLMKGILEHSIVTKDNESKILHGWGHNKSYFVGSFNDPDNVRRDSLTSNAFFVISGMIKQRPDLKEEIIKAFRNLDSKYGLRTFNPHFEEFYGFGRIVNLPKGTAENAATYIHATLFGVTSLYMLGEAKFANEQIYKVLPFTHDDISTSPFIMSNSYIYNEEANMDGESMSDWYTGAANTFLKSLIRGLFGFEVSLDTIKLKPAKEFFSKQAEYLCHIGNKVVLVKYTNTGNNNRKILLNNNELELELDNISNTMFVNINKADLLDDNVINIID